MKALSLWRNEKGIAEGYMNIEEELLNNLETLRINLDVEAWYDPTGAITRRCERANEMLDDCLEIVKNTFSRHNF